MEVTETSQVSIKYLTFEEVTLGTTLAFFHFKLIFPFKGFPHLNTQLTIIKDIKSPSSYPNACIHVYEMSVLHVSDIKFLLILRSAFLTTVIYCCDTIAVLLSSVLQRIQL